jgi:hypothetical protein
MASTKKAPAASTETFPERPAVVERSSILKMRPRPEGLETIDPLIGLRTTDPDQIQAETEARKERYAKIKEAGGGDFRIIHGTMHVPRPLEEIYNPDGSRKENEKPFVTAKEGDIVRLSVDDAFRALEQGLVEELDAKPSRVGKVFSPPKVVQQFSGLPANPPAKTAESRA